MSAARVRTITNNWWLFLVYGMAATLFGLVTVASPIDTLAVFTFFVGFYLLVAGATALISSLLVRRVQGYWWLHLVLGILEMLFGVYLLKRPELSLDVFITLVAVALMMRGIIDIVHSVATDSTHKVLGIIAGALAILAGVVVWRYPVEGTLAFVWVIGLYALIAGPLWIVAALEMKQLDS